MIFIDKMGRVVLHKKYINELKVSCQAVVNQKSNGCAVSMPPSKKLRPVYRCAVSQTPCKKFKPVHQCFQLHELQENNNHPVFY